MEHEFDILNRRMEKNLEMRHTYLMFAFTTSIAAIAALFVVDFANITPWICIVPFAVIIPFQARISYSRLTHALFGVIKKNVLKQTCLFSVDCIAVFIATAIVFGLATYTFSYGTFLKKYIREYKKTALDTAIQGK